MTTSLTQIRKEVNLGL